MRTFAPETITSLPGRGRPVASTQPDPFCPLPSAASATTFGLLAPADSAAIAAHTRAEHTPTLLCGPAAPATAAHGRRAQSDPGLSKAALDTRSERYPPRGHRTGLARPRLPTDN